tara:strand:- start:409 stop:645 length:237 start_codon:yes stop_codon:yes gene_type:complete
MRIDPDSEEFIRKSVKDIEERLKFYENNYAIKDKQDLLAMCLIEYASKFELNQTKKVMEDDDVFKALKQIESIIDTKV